MSRQTQEKKTQTMSTFWTNLQQQKTIFNLIKILLVLIIIFVFTKIAHLFAPIGQILNLFLFPILASAILFYLFTPLVNRLYEEGIKKSVSVLMIFIFLLLAITLSIGSIIPIIREQLMSFMNNIPIYYDTILNMIEDIPFLSDDALENIALDLQRVWDNLSIQNLTQRLNPIVSSTFGGITNIVGTVTTALTGLITIPIFTYYLLVESKSFPSSILKYVPSKYQDAVENILFKSHSQVSRYIRGQIIVAVCVGFLFAIGYAMIGLEYGTTLAVLSGILNIIPYLGSFIATIPALIIGLLTSPMMFIKVILVLMIEQTIEGRLISPQVLGNSLKIHPVTILVVLLASGKLFGVPGVIVGVPIYAVIKVIISEIYAWYRSSKSKEDDEEIIVKVERTEVEIFEDEKSDTLSNQITEEAINCEK